MTENDSSSNTLLGGGLGAGLAQKALEPILRAIREEVDSARHEIGARANGAKAGAALTAVGAIVAIVALGLLAALGVDLVALTLAHWAATAIVFGVFVIAAAVLVAAGIRGLKRGVPPVPRDTLSDVRDRVTPSFSKH